MGFALKPFFLGDTRWLGRFSPGRYKGDAINQFLQTFGVGSFAQIRADINFIQRKQAIPQLTFGREPQSIATAAEGTRYGSGSNFSRRLNRLHSASHSHKVR